LFIQHSFRHPVFKNRSDSTTFFIAYKGLSKWSAKEKYNSEPNIFTAYGYEAIAILSKAIDKSETHTATDTRIILLNNSFDSMTGNLSFDKTGELNRSYGILKILDNKFIGYKEK